MHQQKETKISPDRSDHRRPDLIANIKDRYASLRPAEQSVADAILSDIPNAINSSNGEIAQKANVSQPTVTRFCRSVGCKGVRDFRLQLAQSLIVGDLFLESEENTWKPKSSKDTPPFWGTVLSEARLALREVEAQLDPSLVMQAAAKIAPAQRVLTLGLGGSSSTLAEELQNRLFRYGIPVTACKDPYVARMTVSTFRPGDVFIAISSTGRTREVIECIEIARYYSAETIVVTAPDSELSKTAEIALTTKVSEYPDALTPSASRYAFTAIIDLIAAATGYQMAPLARENLRRIKFNQVNQDGSEKLEPLGD